MKERPDTGRTVDRDVGGGMRERAGTGKREDRDVGGGMRERARTDTVDVYDNPEIVNQVVIDPVPVVPVVPVIPPVIDTTVSYGSTPQTGIVRIDDLPRNKARVQRDCSLLAAKVARLMKQLGYEQAVLATLQGAQNVNLSPTITGTSTSFASEEAQQAAIERMQSEIATTEQLLAQYQADLIRCVTRQ